jgi:hypothetical protein
MHQDNFLIALLLQYQLLTVPSSFGVFLVVLLLFSKVLKNVLEKKPPAGNRARGGGAQCASPFDLPW